MQTQQAGGATDSAKPRTGRLAVLAEPDFRRLWIGQVVSNLGDRITPIALAFAVLSIDGSASDLGLVIACGTVPLAILLLVGGVLADRLDRRRIMLASDLTRAAVQAILAGSLISGHAQVWQIATLAAVFGAAEAFFRPAATGLLPQVVSSERLAEANALVGISANIAMIGGPVLAGAVVTLRGPAAAIAADAVSFLVSAAFLRGVRPVPLMRGVRRSFLHELTQGFREVAQRRWLSATVLGFTVYHMVVLPGVTVLGPVIALRRYHGASSWALMTVGFGAGAIVGSIVALHLRPRRPVVVTSLLLVVGSSQPFVIALGLPVLAVAAVLAVAGGSIAVLFAVWDTTLAVEVEPSALSRVSSLDYFGTVVGMPLGFAAVGPLADHFGLVPVMVTVSLVGMGWPLLTVALPDVRRLRSRLGTP
jgi:MFS family permease